MYDHTLHRGRKNKLLRCLRRVNILNAKILEEKKITVYDLCSLESILVPKDNEKHNPNESYTNKCQKHVACSYG